MRDGVELVAAGGAVEGLRAVKDAEELDAIRAAAKLADDALAEVLTRGLAGRTERDVALDIEFTMRRMGAEAVSFPPIVAAGRARRAAARGPARRRDPGRHARASSTGARCSTATPATARAPTAPGASVDPRDRAVYDLVAHAQEAALAAVRPGPTGREVDAVARAIIDDGRPRRALRPRPRARRRPRGPRGPAAGQDGRGRARGRATS